MSLAHSLSKPATYEDLCAVPDHLVAEIIYGVLEPHPRPAPPAPPQASQDQES